MNIRKIINDIYLNSNGKQLFYLLLIFLLIIYKFFWIGICLLLLWYGYKLYKVADIDIKDYCEKNSNNTLCKTYNKNLNENEKIAKKIRNDILKP